MELRTSIELRSRGTRLASLLFATAFLAVGTTRAQAPTTAAQKPAETPAAVQQQTTQPAEGQTPASDAGVPNLEVDTPVWDFGEKWSGEKAETTVSIRNTGTAVLKIDQVKSSCGCTVAQTKKKELAPGESDEIKITYNTKKQTEKVSQKIRIMSNDPDSPTTMVEVKGHVKQLVKMEDKQGMNFGTVGMNDVLTKSIEFECAYEKPLDLILEENKAPYFELKLDTVEAGKRYKLTATTKPPLPDGHFTTNAVLKTGLESMPEVSIRVWGVAAGPVSVSKKVIYVTGDKDEPSTTTLQVTCRGDKPANITSVKADLDTIQAEVMPATPSKIPNAVVRVVQVKLPPASELPDQDIALRITTDDPEVKELVVPIRKNPGRSRSTAAEVTPVKPVRERPSLSSTPAKTDQEPKNEQQSEPKNEQKP